jgi:heme/copper-type cytochrome/quinol oxidase subunit 2
MLPFRPFLLLGDITGLLWLVGITIVGGVLAILIGIVVVGKRDFVAKAATPEGKSRRFGLLLLVAPILAIIIFFLLLIGL